ncbi:hypothetical protein GLAREA_09656 [Glarea lozoyensis ATCC 20868]|uniref:Uncharacterized protein n=1 Tax=Glarea lozoyensis (strain ATCC 20868 / MF5171) TaxID=1116229 RepID=S3CS77_GLAL2|nr:uncharacterized protein GLAREA_09656 [Glarea lozoyensis ATCC 20868]EPE28535.1 hypothetical protein GLAREA_09656 [Glarea lozoyensis ATCC 20868]
MDELECQRPCESSYQYCAPKPTSSVVLEASPAIPSRVLVDETPPQVTSYQITSNLDSAASEVAETIAKVNYWVDESSHNTDHGQGYCPPGCFECVEVESS